MKVREAQARSQLEMLSGPIDKHPYTITMLLPSYIFPGCITDQQLGRDILDHAVRTFGR